MYEQQQHQGYNPQSQDSSRPQYPQTQNFQASCHPQQQNRNNGRLAQEEASIKKAAAETKYFWSLVARGHQKKQHGVPETTNDGNDEKKLQQKRRTEMLLFGGNAEMYKDIPRGVFQDVQLGVAPEVQEGDADEKDPVVVERSGAGEKDVAILESFNELKNDGEYEIPSFIIDNIALMKYDKPTPIQKHSIPLGIKGFDLMCCAQTGSGKTFSFLLPVVSALSAAKNRSVDNQPSGVSRNGSLDSGCESQSNAFTETETEDNFSAEDRGDSDSQALNGGSEDGSASPCRLEDDSAADCASARSNPSTRVHETRMEQGLDDRGCLPSGIILAPTRELVCQINIEAKKICYNSNIKSVVIYGGTDVRTQLLELSTGCDLIVATPGRLFDLVERGVISFCQVSFLVLDEADRMLDMGFEPQIRKIVLGKDMPSKNMRQTFLFSATFPDTIKNLAKNFLRDSYIFISVGRVGSTVKNIHQRLLQSSADQSVKIKMLINTINEVEGRTLIFVQKKKTASWVNSFLRNAGIKSEEIHGNCTQLQRENSLRNFKNGNNLILIATDVAARGLDVPSVTHVIQFDMPMSSEDFDTYVHRIGRTGRAGKSGVATSFYVPGRGGESNGGIAAQLLELMTENNQPVPDWFSALDDARFGHSARRSNYMKGGQNQGNIWSKDTRGYPRQQGNYGGVDGGDYNNGNRYQAQGGGGYGGDNGQNGGGNGNPGYGYQRQMPQHQQQQQYPQQQQQYMRGQQMRQSDPMPRYQNPNQYPQVPQDQGYMGGNRPAPAQAGVAAYYNPYQSYSGAQRDGMQMMTAQMGHMNMSNGAIQERPNTMYRIQQPQQQHQQQRGDGYVQEGRSINKDARPYAPAMQMGVMQGQVSGQGYHYAPRYMA